MGEEFQVSLQGGSPWGFRLQGGKEFRSPLRIAKVEPTGKAGRSGVKVGDHVTAIDGASTGEFYHTEALAAVKRAGGVLQLNIFRPEDDGSGSGINGYAPSLRSGSVSLTPRRTISNQGSLDGRISISPSLDRKPINGNSDSYNGDNDSDYNRRNTFASTRSYNSSTDGSVDQGYQQQEREQWSSDIINAAVTTPGQISIDANQPRPFGSSSSEDYDERYGQARSSTLPRRPQNESSNLPRQLSNSSDPRSQTMPRKSSAGSRAPQWYKQMYKEMNSSMDGMPTGSHLGVLLASDAAKGAFRSYDGATSPGGNRSLSPDIPPQRKTSDSTTVEFRSNRSAATLPNRKSMPIIPLGDGRGVRPPSTSTAVKSSWYKEMQKGGEIPATGLSTRGAPSGPARVMKYNEETKEIKPVSARVSRPPPVKQKPANPRQFEYNNPPDLMDLRRREEASGVRHVESERDIELNEEARRRQREHELKEQAQVELLRQQEEQEFELERQAELERQRIAREKRRFEEEQQTVKYQKALAAREEAQMKEEQEQRRKDELERREAKRLLEEQRQHQEQQRLNERRRQEEERRKDDEKRREEERRQDEERLIEDQKRQEKEELLERERRRQEEIRRKEEEDKLQAEELQRIAAFESSIKSNGDDQQEEIQLAKALYSFRPQSDSELTFRKGDTIKILGMIDENWYEGELDGAVGIFPSTYVKILEPEIKEIKEEVKLEIVEGLAKARYTFKAESPKELPFKKGDMIVLLRRIDEHWYEGELNDTIGIFPIAYVEVLREAMEREVSVSNNRKESDYVDQVVQHSVPMEEESIKTNGQLKKVINESMSLDEIAATYEEPPSEIITEVHTEEHTDLFAKEGERHRARYGYRPQNQDELELHEGDMVLVLEKCDDGWFVGTCERSGSFGTFPGNYVVPL